MISVCLLVILNLWCPIGCYFTKFYKLIYRPLQVPFSYFAFFCEKIYSKVCCLFIDTCFPITYYSAFVQNYRFENTKVVMCLSCMFLFKSYLAAFVTYQILIIGWKQKHLSCIIGTVKGKQPTYIRLADHLYSTSQEVKAQEFCLSKCLLEPN